MARIVVAGGGICGMAAALMLARDGHDIVVLDRDEGPVPADVDAAWSWPRRSVSQFRLAHLMMPAGHGILAAELPDVATRLVDVGGLRLDVLSLPPTGTAHEDDGRFVTTTARRSTIEWVLATTLADEPHVDVRRGAPIAGLLAGPAVADGIPHVTGVRLTTGEEVTADLVIDATGRRSPTTEWLAELGARPAREESEDVGFTYTGRFFRSADGSLPEQRTPGLTPCGSISLLTIPSDNGTWSATLYTASNDAALRRARDPEAFERIWRAFPDHAHWLDGEPISDLMTMSGIVDRTRHFVVDGMPVATGVVSIADVYVCTNPSIGRGMTIGLMHTVLMRDAVREHLADPLALALAFDAATEANVAPWHEATRALDRGRMDEMQAILAGRQPDEDQAAAIGAGLATAAEVDEDAARWLAEIVSCLALPLEVFSRPGVFARVLELSAELPPPPAYGPDRTRLLELIA